jgi:sec-independent protein translocase protein TatA
MALIGYEWLILVAVILIIFLWGPQKLPELARSIGLAKKEFDKAAKEISNPTTSTSPPSSEAPSPSTDPLIVAARSLGISTEGKTKEQIAKEIAQKSGK